MMIRIIEHKRKYTVTLLVTFLLIAITHKVIGQQKKVLENELYKISLLKDGKINIVKKGQEVKHTFSPEFMIMYSDTNPELRNIYNRHIGMRVPSWESLVVGYRTAGFFNAAKYSKTHTVRAEIKKNRIIWNFDNGKDYIFHANLRLPRGKEDPVVSYHMNALKAGWYSVGYMGAPVSPFKNITEMWQPLIWQEKRFPYMPFLSTENMCPLPTALVNKSNSTIGIVADPSEIPYRYSTLETSRFGVLLRDPDGKARPMIFAPVFGGYHSHLKKEDKVDFKFRIVIQNESLFDTYKYIAKKIFGFHDYRKNVNCSLNETLENMISYAMNNYYSGWNPELKGSDYATDVEGTVKNVSALHPLSIAIVTDNKQIYERRALPMIEYLLSRKKYLYATNPQTKGQSPSHFMEGPSANVSELAALYKISNEQTPVFEHYVKKLYGESRVLNLERVIKGSSWQNSLALYRMTDKKAYLDSAVQGANIYIEKRINTVQTDFSDVHIPSGARFPNMWTPKWMDLLELYEQTKNKKYLKAAKDGAERFINFIWMVPQIPDGNITINQGDTVGTYAYQNDLNPDPQPMRVAEQEVPAWVVSQIGLMPESTTTYIKNRALFLSMYAPALLRLAYYTHSAFFHSIARAAVVGRYANYPGYSITGEYTNIYSQSDYPLKTLDEITYSTIYYNHIWPHIAMVMDYLVSDIYTRSKGTIHFPSRYAQGYAYLKCNVYGDRTGEFYGDEKVQLWIPNDLLHSNNIQVNYIAGYGNNKLYLVFTNQSKEDIKVNIHLNSSIVPYTSDKDYAVKLWKNNQLAGSTEMHNGMISFSIKADGITALAVKGISIVTQFQNEILEGNSSTAAKGYTVNKTPLGKVHGMIIDMGKSLTNAYIYLEATEKDLKEASLYYKRNGQWEKIMDNKYPFEFSVSLNSKEKEFKYKVEGVGVDGKTMGAKTIILKL